MTGHHFRLLCFHHAHSGEALGLDTITDALTHFGHNAFLCDGTMTGVHVRLRACAGADASFSTAFQLFIVSAVLIVLQHYDWTPFSTLWLILGMPPS